MQDRNRPTSQDLVTAANPSADGPARRVAGRYLLGRLLGRGGHGSVWQAEDEVAGGQVAVKILASIAPDDVARMQREISALRLLDLPGVVRLLDEGSHDGQRFLVTELLDGKPFPGRSVPMGWHDLAPTAIAMLEALARVHSAGVLHRDLKPPNVLVDSNGAPCILDFGLAIGEQVGRTVTADGQVVGTLAYLAPEQILGKRADERADLYALGVMFYVALTGEAPHQAETVDAMLRARLAVPARPIDSLVVGLPRPVASLIDRLLASRRERRPRSAHEALLLLGSEPAQYSATGQLPWLGSTEPVDFVVERLSRGVPVDVSGPAGSGRSRLIEEVSARLLGQGRELIHVRSGIQPFAGLWPLLPPSAEMSALDLNAAIELAGRCLSEALGRGVVLLVDDWPDVDRWSAAAIEARRTQGAVLRCVDDASAADMELEPLTEEVLAELFVGPERIFHLPSGAARELHERTGGHPSAVASEVGSWVRAGLARFRDGRVEVGRAELHRLRSGLFMTLSGELGRTTGAVIRQGERRSILSQTTAARRLDKPRTPGSGPPTLPEHPHLVELLAWLHMAWPHGRAGLLATVMERPLWQIEAGLAELVEAGAGLMLEDGRVEPRGLGLGLSPWPTSRRMAAHRSLARALPQGSAGRLLHLVAAEAAEGLAEEAATVAWRCIRRGEVAEGLVAVREALRIVRRHDDQQSESQLLHSLMGLAHSDGTLTTCEAARYELDRAISRSDDVESMKALVSVASLVARGGGQDALEQVNALPTFSSIALDVWRQDLKVRVGRTLSLVEERRILDEISGWARLQDSELARARYATWLGKLRYREGRFEDSAALHATAASADVGEAVRMFAMMNRASALLEAGRLEEAQQQALKAQQAGRLCDHIWVQAQAEWLQRTVAYRQDRCGQPDLALLDAVERTNVPYLAVLVGYGEAAVAWRNGDTELAEQLAEVAAERAENLQLREAMVLCHAVRCLAARAPLDASVAAVMPLMDEIDSQVAAQAISALASVGYPLPSRWRELVVGHLAEIPDRRRSARADLLSADEMGTMLAASV